MRFTKTLKSRKGKEIRQSESLKEIFEKNKAKFAYLFGSYGKGKSSEFSDIDIAVMFKKGVEKEKILDSLRIDLIKFLDEEGIDLVDFEEAPPKLQYKIIEEGKIIYGKPDKKLENDVRKKYFDFRPVEKLWFKKMRERIENDRYGH